MDLGLLGKHAIVTGGSRGIGKAIARELAREGVDVAIVARNKGDLEVTARELAAETNRRIVPLAADVTSKEQVDRMVAEAAQRRLANRDRPDRNGHRRGFAAGFQHEICRRAALFPRRHPVHEDGGLGPNHQHQRRQRPQRHRPASAASIPTRRRPGPSWGRSATILTPSATTRRTFRSTSGLRDANGRASSRADCITGRSSRASSTRSRRWSATASRWQRSSRSASRRVSRSIPTRGRRRSSNRPRTSAS